MKNKKKLVSIITATSLVATSIPSLPVYAAPHTGKVTTAEETLRIKESQESKETNTKRLMQKGEKGLGDPNRELHQEYGETYINFSRYTHEDGTPYTGLYKSTGQWYVLDKDGFNRRNLDNPNYAWMNSMYTADFMIGVGPNLNKVDGKYYLGRQISVDNAAFIYMLKQQWLQIAGQWFYADENAVCYQNEWVKINGSWYYFGDDFAMVKNTTIDGYTIGEDGKMIK